MNFTQNVIIHSSIKGNSIHRLNYWDTVNVDVTGQPPVDTLHLSPTVLQHNSIIHHLFIYFKTVHDSGYTYSSITGITVTLHSSSKASAHLSFNKHISRGPKSSLSMAQLVEGGGQAHSHVTHVTCAILRACGHRKF
jgi:hypothetical protein